MSRDSMVGGAAAADPQEAGRGAESSLTQRRHRARPSGCAATTPRTVAQLSRNAPTAAGTVAQLTDLPDELLRHVFESVALISRRDLCAVSLVNKSWHELADAILYKKIRFETPEQHLVFSDSLKRRMRRGSAIQDVSLEYPTHELSHLRLDGHIHGSHYHPANFEALSRTISTMSNLEKLEVSVPATLLHGIGALFNGPFDLACLKSCTLFYQCPDDAYWDLRENIHIFAHPTLEHLTIRKAKLDYRGFDFIEKPHETSLQTLELIECDINDDALSDVLEFPKGLREFVMTQAEEPCPELEESSDNMSDYIMALKSQAHSLESIIIDHPTLTGRKPARMRNFEVLKVLHMNWDYQLFGKKSNKPRLHSAGLAPELETLQFTHQLGTDEEVTELFEYTLQMAQHTNKKLKTVIVVEDDDGVPKEIVAACKDGGIKLDIIGAFEDHEEEHPIFDEPAEMDAPEEQKNGIQKSNRPESAKA
ncbi:F-box domain-containing protein [Pestalotiopsis sp. NC0098]|nr:F-box domain-containing protein [Pestalotiopsis sp. NC0098]